MNQYCGKSQLINKEIISNVFNFNPDIIQRIVFFCKFGSKRCIRFSNRFQVILKKEKTTPQNNRMAQVLLIEQIAIYHWNKFF